MPFIVNGVTYKSKKSYYIEMHPEHTDATANDIDRYLYNNVKEYHESKRTYYREKYRTKKNNEVRKYIKFKSEEIKKHQKCQMKNFKVLSFQLKKSNVLYTILKKKKSNQKCMHSFNFS